MSTITDRHAPQPSVFPKSHVGFDSITSQIERKLLKRGFQFNVICVGEFTLGCYSKLLGNLADLIISQAKPVSENPPSSIPFSPHI
jgi:septin family protein